MTALRVWRGGLVTEAEDEAAREAEAAKWRASEASVYDYMADYLSRHNCKSSTMDGYLATVASLRGTPLGAMRLQDVRSRDVEEWEQALLDRGLSTTTVAGKHACLAMVVKYAVAAGDLEKNPLGLVRAPKKLRKPVNALPVAKAREVMDHLAAMGDTDLSVAARIALLCGMRRAEICALRWRDIDFDNNEIRVIHALTKVKGDFRLDTPKDTAGGDSTRVIPMGASLRRLFSEVKDAQRSTLAEPDGGWSDDLFVLGDPLKRTWRSPNKLSQQWTALSQVMCWTGTQGQRVTFHDLRHTFATISLANGMDVMSLASILSHRDVSMTLNVYAIALKEPKQRAMAVVDSIFWVCKISGWKLVNIWLDNQDDAHRIPTTNLTSIISKNPTTYLTIGDSAQRSEIRHTSAAYPRLDASFAIPLGIFFKERDDALGHERDEAFELDNAVVCAGL